MDRRPVEPIQSTPKQRRARQRVGFVGILISLVVLVAVADGTAAPDQPVAAIPPAAWHDRVERVAAAPPSPTPRATPRASPSATPDPSGTGRPESTWSETFTSDRHGYSIRHPPGWVMRTPAESGSDEFFAPTPSRTRLSIVRRPKPRDMSMDAFAEDVFPHRAQSDGCHWDSAGTIFIPAAQGRFEETQIDGRRAVVRSECSLVEAMIDDGDDVVLVVLRSGKRMPTGDRWNFDRFMETLHIDPQPTAASEEPVPSASDEAWSRFRSTDYGYAIRYPREWLVVHTEIGRRDVFADDLSTPASFNSKLLIVRRTIPDGTSIRDAALGWFGHRGVIKRKCGSRLPFFGRMYQAAPFVETTIAGNPALVRSECSVIHAIVDLDGEALLLTLRSRKSMARGDDVLFRQLVETLEIDPSTE